MKENFASGKRHSIIVVAEGASTGEEIATASRRGTAWNRG